jgi:hypothetical protein
MYEKLWMRPVMGPVWHSQISLYCSRARWNRV